MITKSTGLIERVKRPDYIGENRCTPCTIVNATIAAVASAAVSVVATPLVGVPFLGLCLAAIYLRGYLVPGTPTLTQRYFPDRLLAMFDKRERETPEVGADEREPEEVLVAAGAVEPCEGVDDLCLDDTFRAAWYDRMEAITAAGTEKRDLGRVLDADEGDLSFVEHDEAMVARLNGRRLGQWESRAALVADLAAAKLLGDRYGDWDALTVANRSRVLSGLRIFLDDCPGCGGAVAVDQETVESCCRTVDVIAVGCTECGARLLEVEQ